MNIVHSAWSWLLVSGLALGCGTPADSGASSADDESGGSDSADAGALAGGGGAPGAGGTSKGGTGGKSSGGAGGMGGASGTGGKAGTGGASGGTGGAAGTGGTSGGTGGTIVHPPPKPCPGAGSSAIGEWQNLVPPGVHIEASYGGFNTGTVSFALDPSDTRIVYLGTHGQGIYKSSDCGASWDMVNTGQNGVAVGSGRNWTMAVDPSDGNVVYANSGYGNWQAGGFFKSTNAGVDWTQLLGAGSDFDKYVPADFVEFVALDPTNPKHLLVSAHNACTGPYAGSGTCYATSTDAGASWTMLSADPNMGYEAVGQTMIDANTWIYYGWGVFITKDAGKTWTKTVNNNLVMNQTGAQYKADDGNYYLPSSNGVLKSKDLMTWTAIPNSPHASSLAGDGTTMFLSNNQDASAPYFVSTGDYSVWNRYPGPAGLTKGSWLMRYDRDHNLLYTSNETGGFWRVQTK
jgi:hypothetical protein